MWARAARVFSSAWLLWLASACQPKADPGRARTVAPPSPTRSDGRPLDCAKAAFRGELQLTVKRELPVGAELREDGDFALYKKAPDGQCGLLLRRIEPVAALFVICGHRVIAGPLTTPDEVKGVTRDLSDQRRAAYDVRRSVVPASVEARYTVVDSRRSFLPSE